MIEKIRILFGKDGFRKNDLLLNIGLKGLVNDKILNTVRLKKGEEIVVVVPENFNGFKVKKWNFEEGNIVDYSDIICEVENEKYVAEFESFHLGEISFKNKTEKPLKPEEVLFKIKGI